MLEAPLLAVVLILLILVLARLLRAEQEIERLRALVEPRREAPVPRPSPLLPSLPELHAAELHAVDVERAIGERWLLYAGVAVLLVAVSVFLRYALDRDWIAPLLRVVLGTVGGLGLLAAGRVLAARYRAYGLILAGGGFATLYLTTYAAETYYHLLNPPAALIVLAIISLVAAGLAHRDAAPTIAAAAVAGAFAAPWLVTGAPGEQVALFTYVALVIAVSTTLSLRHDWWYLDLLSFGATTATVGAWLVAYHAPSDSIRTVLFLALYCAMFLVALRAHLLWGNAQAQDGARLLLLAPVAFHCASIALLEPEPSAFLAYMILVTVAAVVIADRADVPVVRAITLGAVALPLAIHFMEEPRPVVAGASAVIVIYIVQLGGSLRAVVRRPGPPAAEIVALYTNGIALMIGLGLVFHAWSADQIALLALILAVWNLGLAAAVSRVAPAVSRHWMATSAVLLAMAIAERFNGVTISAAWGVEAAIAITVGIRRGWAPLRYVAILLFGMTLLRVFAVDLRALDSVYRIASFFVVGVVLLFASFMYQRRRSTSAG